MKSFKVSPWGRLGLSAFAALLVACSDPQVSRDRYFNQGNAAFQQKQYAEAILAYRNALKADPLYAPARQKLADAYQHQGELANAAREYIRAADLLPNDAAAQLAAARVLALGGQFDDAGTRAKRALEIDPKNVEAHIRLGSSIAATKDFDGAIKQIQQAIAVDPTNNEAHVNMGALLLAQKRHTEAEASFKKAIELAPRSIDAHLAFALFYLNTGKVVEAERVLKRAVEIDPTAEQANRAMATLLIGTGRPKEAEPYVKAATETVGTPQAELAFADYYLQIGRIEEARTILDRLARSAELYAPANVRLARLDYVANRKDAAHKRLDGVLERAPSDVEALTVKGQWLLVEGQTKEARRLADLAVKADPGSAAAQFLLGRAMLALGDRQGAEEAYTEVLRLNPRAAAAQTELARLKLFAGDGEAALQLARDAVTAQPSNNDARMLLVRSLIANRQLERAGTELAPLLRDFPNHATVRALNGMLLALKNDGIGARREYERAIQQEPNQLDALSGLTTLDAQSGQLARARERLAVQLARAPTNAPLLLLAARADLQARDYALGERRLREVLTLDASYMEVYGLLAHVYQRQGKVEEARKELETVVQRLPRAVGAHTMIGMLYEQQNRLREAEAAYGRALEVDPTTPVAANNLAYLWAERNHNLEEALALARAAAERLDRRPPILDTVGWIYYKKGQPELAIPQFQGSIEKEPNNPMYHYHLGLAYVKAGQRDKARGAFEEALRLSPSFPGADEARRTLQSLTS